uniref:spindle and kinetochore-associated protein 2-like n=1 Tax=Odobenus rosmarus divergens TaxID=9708 RepID=UPI00063CC51A|nr:PREDICTED: spindle and kinetochore-associated protein 2-like [Odobenus rosmarus divergens]
MEAEVNKMELMFQKADSDPDYIQYRLENEIKTNHPDSAGKKNLVTLLKELLAIKSQYQTLHARFKPVAVKQKETKSYVYATVLNDHNTKTTKQTDLGHHHGLKKRKLQQSK